MFFLVILSFLLPLFSPQAYGAENEVITFGKQEGFNFIIAVPETPGTLNSIQFSRIVSFFSEAGKKGTLPDARISVISTKNDYSRLPENLRPEVPEGTAGVISMLEQESSGIVILVLPEEETGITTVKYGVKYETSPPELLTAVTKAFDESRGIWKLEETKIELYRIGWVTENHILAAYLNAGVPALAVCTGQNISSVLMRTMEILSETDPPPMVSDRHYILLTVPDLLYKAASGISRFFYENRNFLPKSIRTDIEDIESGSQFTDRIFSEERFFILSERLMVAAVILCLAVFLFYLCLFTFLHPVTRRRRRRELVRVLPYPFLYSVLNIIALYAGGHITALLFSARFGKPDAWILLPKLAFLTKLSITFLFVTSFSVIKNSLLFPKNPQILGYIAALSSFMNIFIFLVIEFSLAPYFITCFLLASVCFYSKNKILQIIFTVMYVLVFLPFYRQILTGNTAALSMLYNGDNGWNVWAAFFAVPVQLMISRIIVSWKHDAGKTGKAGLSVIRMEINPPKIFKRDKKVKIYIPVLPAAAFILVLVSVSTVLFTKAWSDRNPLKIRLNQNITDEGLDITMEGPADPGKVDLKRTGGEALPPFSDITPENFLDVSFSSRMFLDRTVYELVIEPAIPASRIDVQISTSEGIAVQTASQPFEFEEGGSSAVFASGENPDTPLHVNFITGSTGTLCADISFWSVENPFGFVIDKSDIKTEPLLFVRHKTTLKDGE